MQNSAVYRRRSRRAPILTTAMEGTYLAIEDEESDWYGILMADGSTGWVPAPAVRKLDYQVEAAGEYHASPTGSLPGYSAADDIYPRTSTPYFGGDAQTLLKEAYKYLGVPYVWGGNTVHGLFRIYQEGIRYYRLQSSPPRFGSDGLWCARTG
jgi:cell wall-associated NlpC family hydrolase